MNRILRLLFCFVFCVFLLASFYIFDFTGCLLPQALHFRLLKSPSFVISVSGFPQSGQSTNSCAYCLIFSFILLAGIFAPRTRRPFLSISPGVASSFSTNFSRCSVGLLSVLATCVKFVSTVLFPSMCPRTFGISNLSFSNTLCGSFSLALVSSLSYSIYSRSYASYLKLFACNQKLLKWIWLFVF